MREVESGRVVVRFFNDVHATTTNSEVVLVSPFFGENR